MRPPLHSNVARAGGSNRPEQQLNKAQPREGASERPRPAQAPHARTVRRRVDVTTSSFGVAKPPPSPPIKVLPRKHIEPLAGTDSLSSSAGARTNRSLQVYSRSMPVTLTARPTLANSEAQANRLRERYLQSLTSLGNHIPPRRTIDIPLTTSGGDSSNSNKSSSNDAASSESSKRSHKKPIHKQLAGTSHPRIDGGTRWNGSSSMGSLDKFNQRRELKNHSISQPVKIRASDSILGFWDSRSSARMSSRRRHTTGGSPAETYNRYDRRHKARASKDDSNVAQHNSLRSGVSNDQPTSQNNFSIANAKSEEPLADESGTYLTAAAVSRSRRTTAEMIGTAESIAERVLYRRPGPSSLLSGASGVGQEEELEIDDQLDDQLLFTDEPGSPVDRPLQGGSSIGGSSVGGNVRYRGGYGSSNTDDARSTVSDSDTDGALYGSDTGHSSSGADHAHAAGSGRAGFLERERRRRHSSADTPFFSQLAEVAERDGDAAWGGSGTRTDFVPPHMMAEKQRGTFSMGYHRTFRPKPKDI